MKFDIVEFLLLRETERGPMPLKLNLILEDLEEVQVELK